MFPTTYETVSVLLGRFDTASISDARVQCPDCKEALDMHQPDERSPERLLGTCQGCSAWFLIDMMPEEATWMVVTLPDTAFRQFDLGH